MYLGSWKIDDVLTFTCNTHTPSTGAVTDADAVPTYRVYEDETGTPILTGSTAKLDDAGTTGYYSEQITLSAANGLEKGKTYTIRMSATVGGVAGAMSHTFQIEAEVDANVVSDKTGFDLAADQSAITIGTVTLVTTTTTNTDMRGTDSAALATNYTSTRAGYLDNLSGGAVALAAGVDVTQWLGTAVTANVAGQPTVDVTRLGAQTAPLIDLVDFASNGYDSTNNVVFSDLVYIHGSALTETAGQLAAGFTKLFDVATPLLVASDVMRGTDSAALAATALTDVTWTDAKAAFIDHSIATVDTNIDTLLTRITAARAGYLDNLSAGAVALAATALTDVTWTDAKAAFLDHSIATVDTNVDTLLTRITAARAGYLDNLSAGAVALASALATAQTDLDTITGTDGVTLATAQALYAPNKVVPDVAGTAAGLHSTTDGLVTTVDTVVDAIKAKTDNLPDGIKKNTAITAFTFLMVQSSDHVTGATGLTVAGNYSGDGGAVAALTNTGAITEISNGLYEIDLTAGELNYENVTLIFTASGADARVITIHTST